MLAYAAARTAVAKRGSSPNAMLVIVGAHVAVIAAVMSAKMDLPDKIRNSPIVVEFIHEPTPPPPEPLPQPQMPTRHQQSVIDRPQLLVPVPPTPGEIVDSTPTPLPSIDPIIGPAVDPAPLPLRASPVIKSPARLLTSGEDLKPPYPTTKIASGEEALLKLRLTISESGRVIAVEPVGPADPAFLQAARQHLLAHWRYRPASADGRAITSSTVITLRFQLDG